MTVFSRESSCGAMVSNSELKHGPEIASTLSRSTRRLTDLSASASSVCVVVADELDRHAADAALGVDFLDRDLHGDLRGLAPLGAFAGQRGQAADLDVAAGELGRFGVVRR